MLSLNWLLGLIPSWMPWTIIGFGFVIFLIDFFLKLLIPILYRIALRVLAIILICGGFYVEGRQDVIKNDEYKIKEIVVQQNTITKTVVEKYKEKIDEVKKTNEKIIETITTKDDNMCVLPQSFVSLHDNAAKNTISNSTTGIDGTPSGIALSEAERTIVTNYGVYHQISEQLKALQDWVKQQKELNP